MIQQKAENIRAVNQEIGPLVLSSNAKITSLQRQVDEISMTIEVISEISEQSTLLAIDALLEANRAGEAGKRFAVTAEEMNNLAGQTVLAAGEIRDKMQTIKRSVTGAASDINRIAVVVNRLEERIGDCPVARKPR